MQLTVPPRWRSVAATLFAILVVIGLVTAAPASAAPVLKATFTKTSDWGTGYVAEYKITNSGTSATSSWSLKFGLSPATVTGVWGGKHSSAGSTHTVTNEEWSGTIAAGQSVTVGFEGTYSGTWANPTSCTINGASCSSATPTPTPTPTPTLTPTPTPPPAQSGLRNVGYFAQWGIYGRGFTVDDLYDSGAAARLTHINYAFGNVSEAGRCFEVTQTGQGDAYADYGKSFGATESVDGKADAWDQPLRGNFNQLKKLKAKYPNLKVNISLGGWTWSRYFFNAALPPIARLSSSRASTSTCAVTSRRPTAPAARAPEPASSTASTSTGSGRARRATPATSCGPRTRPTSRRCSASSASS